jgi:hypothetical protein
MVNNSTLMLCGIYIVCTCNLEENKCTLYMCFCVYSVITAYIVFVFNQERLIVSVFLPLEIQLSHEGGLGSH